MVSVMGMVSSTTSLSDHVLSIRTYLPASHIASTGSPLILIRASFVQLSEYFKLSLKLFFAGGFQLCGLGL